MQSDLFTPAKKVTSLSIVRDFILSRKEFTNAEIDDYMECKPGQLSWRTRISDVRKELELEGGSLDCVPVDARHGLYKYIVIRKEQQAEMFV